MMELRRSRQAGRDPSGTLATILFLALLVAPSGCASDGADPYADTYGNESAAEALEEEEREDAWGDANR